MLPCFQDLYMEFLVRGVLGESTAYLMNENDRLLGYAVLSCEGILLEFFVSHAHLLRADDIFSEFLSRLPIQRIYCQSFDFLLQNLCLCNQYACQVIGCLYYDQVPTADYPLHDLCVRAASRTDLQMLESLEDEVFEPKSRLERDVENKGVMLYFQGNELAGCGFLTRIRDDFNFFDLGVWTSPTFRRQGVARRIISHLKRICLDKALIPVCGCDVHNLASQKTLAANGFVSRHSLLEFLVSGSS